MTIEEVFSKIATHFSKGLAIHELLADAYGFLNLRGYRKCHEYHYFEESNNYNLLYDYYLSTYNKLIQKDAISVEEIIPSNWYKHIRQDVDINTKREAIRNLMQQWIRWEQSTKQLLEASYKQLYELDAVDAACEIRKFLTDVSQELSQAQEELIDLEAINYDLSVIVEKQNSLYIQYTKKIYTIFEDDG